MNDLIDPQLGRLVVQSALAARVAFMSRPDEWVYTPVQTSYMYTENEAGWPSVVGSSEEATKEKSLVDWRRILRFTERSTRWELDAVDIPTLAELARYVNADCRLADRVSALAAHAKDPAMRQQMVAEDAVNLVGTVLNRADSVGVDGEQALTSIYAELERGLLLDELVGDLVFPLVLCRIEGDLPFAVSDGITLEELTPDVQLARARSLGSGDDINPYLVAAATHALVLKARTFDNSAGYLHRHIEAHNNPPGIADADLVCEALSIVAGRNVGFAQVCLVPTGWTASPWRAELPSVESLATVRKYPVAMNERGWLKQHEPVSADALGRLPAVFAALRSTDRRAQLASRRLAQTAQRTLRDDVLIDACIGIEALLGEAHAELVHRMSLRAATALSAVGWRPSTAAETLRKVYGYRSAIVHGDVPKKQTITVEGEAFSPSSTAVFMLRVLLDAHLSSTPPWTPSSLDAALFEALSEKKSTVEPQPATE